MGYPTYDLSLDEYQRRALETSVYHKTVPNGVDYAILGLVGEAGEVADKRKKQLRDGAKGPPLDALIAELGDVLWYAAALASELGVSLEYVAQVNLAKLADRASRDAIHGSGDER